MKILVAEDEYHIRKGLSSILQAEGYEVVEAANGEEALTLFEREAPHFVCLDIMMPRLNGYDVCKKIRERDRQVPIIFISAKSEEVDKVLGLELGADDYIVKPFGVREVVARIRTVTRRYLAAHQSADDPATAPFEMHDLLVFPLELRARRGELVIELSLRDLNILRHLHQHRGQAVDRDQLFNAAWGRHYLSSSRTLDQHISKLRKRIEPDPKEPSLIKTVHGFGYRFDPR